MTTLTQLRANGNNAIANPQDVQASFNTAGGFAVLQRMGNLFAQSDLVPTQFKGNLPNCTIAIDMAMRLGANPLLVMQNLFVIQGKPAWSSQFLIATFNSSGKYASIRYEFEGKEGSEDWGCRAVSTELKTGEKLVGPLISIKLAKANGWLGKPGSKWQTMPEQMLRYRAAAWFIRTIAPEIALGMSTVEEVRETIELEQTGSGSYAPPAPENPMDKVTAHVDATPARRRTRKARVEEAPVQAPAPAPEPVEEAVEVQEEAPAAPEQEAAPAQPAQEEDMSELIKKFYGHCVKARLSWACLVECYRKTVKDVPVDEAKAAMANPTVFATVATRYRENPEVYPGEIL